MNIDFRNELAAKLNAGPNFGGPRRSASNTASSGVPGSGDSNNLSFSASSPHTPDSSTYVDTSIEKQSSDAYLEHARLRINLNMQRKHRPASKFANNQLSMSMATSDNSFTSPLLDNIAEEDDGNSVSSRPMPISSLNDANVLLRQRNQISKNSATTRASVGEMMHEACSTSSAKENFVRRSGSSLTTTYPAVRPFDSTPKENKSIIYVSSTQAILQNEGPKPRPNSESTPSKSDEFNYVVSETRKYRSSVQKFDYERGENDSDCDDVYE